MPLILSDYSLKISRTPFDPLGPDGNKGYTYLSKPSTKMSRFKYVCPFATSSIKGLMNTTR